MLGRLSRTSGYTAPLNRARCYARRIWRMSFLLAFIFTVIGDVQSVKVVNVVSDEMKSNSTGMGSVDCGGKWTSGWRWRTHEAAARRRDRALGNNKYGRVFWVPPKSTWGEPLSAVVVPRPFKRDVKICADAKIRKAIRESQIGEGTQSHTLRTASLGAFSCGSISSSTRDADTSLNRDRNVSSHRTSIEQRAFAARALQRGGVLAGASGALEGVEQAQENSDGGIDISGIAAKQDLHISLLQHLTNECATTSSLCSIENVVASRINDVSCASQCLEVSPRRCGVSS